MKPSPDDDNYLEYWARQAKDRIDWRREFLQVLDWQPPYNEWFVGGKLNVSENCLDRHIVAGAGDRLAIHWVGANGESRQITYRQLSEEVNRLANALRARGIERGDRVAIFLPRVPERTAAMLACARVGAVHSVVFAGLSSDALADRLNDATATALITANGGWLDGSHVAFKRRCDEALEAGTSVQTVIVVDRDGSAVDMCADRDVWYHDCISDASPVCPADEIDSEEVLYLLYTSGVTDRPKGIMHTTGGYITQVATTMSEIFAMNPECDLFWCGIDTAWAAGHSYGVYGPLLCGVSSLLYEGPAAGPGDDSILRLLAEHSVSHAYVSPAVVRMWMSVGTRDTSTWDLSALRNIVTFGDTLHLDERVWLARNMGGGSLSVKNTWWQCESGAIMAASAPGQESGVTMQPISGVALDVLDIAGHPVHGVAGALASPRPWPAMLRGVWDQPQRYRSDYWTSSCDHFITGDYARSSPEGEITLLGRMGDLVPMAAGPLSPVEIEDALDLLPTVSESVVVSVPREGQADQALMAFVVVADDTEASDELGGRLADQIEREIGARARPASIAFAPQLPRSGDGKLMRRLLRDVALGRELGDTTTLPESSLMDEIRERAAYPENWCWNGAPIQPGPVVLVDLDGTIADAEERMRGIEKDRENWLDYMVGAGEDGLIVEVARLVQLLTSDVAVVMLSARPISILEETREWLTLHSVRWDLMILRGTTSIDRPRHFKKHRTRELKERNFEPVLALDDDRRNVEMYHSEGVPCLYVHSGIHS